MFSITSFLSLALAASSVVGFAIPVQHRSLHRRYYATDGDLLEPYDIYHARYLNLDCEDQHNTQFFTDCCHPFLKTQDESMLPATCVAPSSTAATVASATATDADVAAPTSTSGSDSSVEAVTGDSSDDDGDYCMEGDDDCECEDDGDSSTATATADADSAPTSAPTDAAANAGGDPATVTTDATATVYSTADAAPTSSSSSSSSGSSDGETFTDGVATFFYQNNVAGACGAVNQDSAVIAAMDSARYGNGELCGKQVHITNTANGKSVVVTVADECPTCDNGNSIDLSTGAFDQIADEATGEVPISWYFMN